MVRGSGRAICGMTLSNNEMELVKDNYQLFLKPRCDPIGGEFQAGDVAAGARRAAVTISGVSGETWRFEADDNAQWRRVPDMADPVLLSRQ